jgi:hypothetical protein
MPIGKHTQMSLEILHLSSQFGSGKRKCGVCIRWRFITNFLKDIWRLTVLATVAIVLAIVVAVVIVIAQSFQYIVSMLTNTCEGSSGKVPDIGDVELLPFPGKYDLVN